MPPSSNDRVILDGLLAVGSSERPDLEASEYFEYFCHRQILKQFNPSDDELESGLTDGSNDGGIDGWFTYVNDDLVDDGLDVPGSRGRNPRIDLQITQTKLADGFAEAPILGIAATLSEVLQLDVDAGRLGRRYNADVLAQSAVFRRAYLALLRLYPTLNIAVTYATRGDTRAISDGVRSRSLALIEQVRARFPDADIQFRFLGARELVDLSRVEPAAALQLNFKETPIATRDNAYVALVRLSDYATFVTDERGDIRSYLFESNVRAYQGTVAINREIRKTLDDGGTADFWWLNNGVTILASRGNMSGKTLTISDVQIVNGLQSTTEIFEYQRRTPEQAARDDRSVLVKVVITEDEDVRNSIVRATNLQTAIQPASFRASDQLQRDIEDYFLSQGWFYDRRKNHYRNLGKPPQLIFGITYLAQAVAAMVLQEPDAARGGVSSLVRDERTYKRVFADSYPPELFLFAANTMRYVDGLVATFTEWPAEVRKKLRYHAAMILVARQLPKPQFAPLNLRSLFLVNFTRDQVHDALEEVAQGFTAYSSATGQSVDPASKARQFTRFLLDRGEYTRQGDGASGSPPSRKTSAGRPAPARRKSATKKPYARRESTLDELLERAAHLGVNDAIRDFVDRATSEWGLHPRVHYFCVNLNAPMMKSVGLVIVGPAGERPGFVSVETAAKSFARFYPGKDEAEYREALGPARQLVTPIELSALGDKIEELLRG